MDLTELGKELLGSGADDALPVAQLVSSPSPLFLQTHIDD